MTDSESTILIKRYASRRLYNTETSEYVTLQQVADIIRSGRNIRIEDFKTGQDLTRQHLIQIIAEQETAGNVVLPVELLFEIVRTYSSQHASMFPEFLENSLKAFHAYQQELIGGLAPDTDPRETFGRFWQQNIDLMDAFMGSWMKTPGPVSTGKEPATGDGDRDQSELDAIKQQLEELQDRMDRIR